MCALTCFYSKCFIEMDKKRIKHLASSVQDLLLTEMKHEENNNEFLTENRHILHHLMDLRQSHIEQFNMFLILLIVSFFFLKFFILNMKRLFH